uniref:Uncharacterized protein n=1 Tax=Rhizophora mucronata TaxID=61149 RepID=A0A2P2PRF4_RHIMU
MLCPLYTTINHRSNNS